MKDQIKILESKIIGLQNSVEFKLNIEYIQSEANQLDFSKYQPEERENIYEAKYKELEETNTKIVEELQKYKRESLGFDEILKEKEERIARLKKTYDELNKAHKIIDKQFSILKLDNARTTQSYNEQKIELDDTIEKLKITNKVRNENELKLNEQMDREKDLKAFLNEKEDRIQKYISEIQKLEKNTFSLRKEKETLESEKSSEAKHFEIQK